MVIAVGLAFYSLHKLVLLITRVISALLNRGLDFTCKALTINRENPSEELSVSFTKAYEQTLKKFHSFVVRPLFSVS